MPTYFNNCRRRDHAGLYGTGAFFDLNLHGRQASMATALAPGDECVVATPTATGNIEFGWYTFSHEATLPDENGELVRVLFGQHIRSEVMDRSVAISSPDYGLYFDVIGRFKQLSVIPRPRYRSISTGHAH